MKLSDSRPIFTQIMAWVEDNILRGGRSLATSSPR